MFDIRLFQIPDLQTIEKECETYQDLIIPLTEDTYHTVGMKLLATFYWLSKVDRSKSALKWIVKLDDDVIVNMKNLDKFMMQHFQEDKIFCRLCHNFSPVRNPNDELYGKWYFKDFSEKLVCRFRSL